MASLKTNVEKLMRARGLSRSQFSARMGMDDAQLNDFLQDPPARAETQFKKMAHELLVPDFLLFAENIPDRPIALPDFRLTQPRPTGYTRPTLRWMDFAWAIQRNVQQLPSLPDPNLGLRAFVPGDMQPAEAARTFRNRLNITDAEQTEAKDSRVFYSEIRKRVEALNAFVLQLSFPDEDGAGFCVPGPRYDVIVINTHHQNHARRLFTLLHECYHCVLGLPGVSDPDVETNAVERLCNDFAVHFIAPERLARRVARETISSRSFDIDELRAFSEKIKLSLHASVLRLVELDIYAQGATRAWARYISDKGSPDAGKRGGGRRSDEWKVKLAKYGFKFAEVFGVERGAATFDPIEVYRFSGIKPKYQRDYFRNATGARAEDAEDDGDGDDG